MVSSLYWYLFNRKKCSSSLRETRKENNIQAMIFEKAIKTKRKSTKLMFKTWKL